MTALQPTTQPAISGHQALAIAEEDAIREYKDLTPYRIELVQKEDGWHIGYFIKWPRCAGGGPHYVIDAETGAILSKKYYQ